MSELLFLEEFDAAIEAMLRGAESSPEATTLDLTQLLAVASELRALPRPQFRTDLGNKIAAELQEESDMTATAKTEKSTGREGYLTVTPYLTVADVHKEIAFIQQAFGAEGKIYGLGSAGGFHSEYKIADAMLMIGGGGEGAKWKGTPTPAALHIYVQDVDQVYERALAAGATSLMPPTDQEYQDRDAAVADVNGNNWYIATHQGTSFVPAEGQRLMPYLSLKEANKMIAFYKQAFAAEEIAVHQSPDGSVLHAKLRIGSSVIEMSQAHGEWKATRMNFMLYVDDADAWYERFMGAEGSISISEPSDQPYGARVGTVEDPAGNQWYLAKQLTAES